VSAGQEGGSAPSGQAVQPSVPAPQAQQARQAQLAKDSGSAPSAQPASKAKPAGRSVVPMKVGVTPSRAAFLTACEEAIAALPVEASSLRAQLEHNMRQLATFGGQLPQDVSSFAEGLLERVVFATTCVRREYQIMVALPLNLMLLYPYQAPRPERAARPSCHITPCPVCPSLRINWGLWMRMQILQNIMQ
jgi:hypothetical protein